MKINPSLPFLLSDVHLYDIESCHYTILKSLGYDLSFINKDDKFERNKTIGLMFRENPRLNDIVRRITTSIIDEYILRNKIKDDEIVLRQYDGIITTRQLKYTTTKYIHLPLRITYQCFLSSIDKQSYISLSDNNTTIKGVKNRYDEMDKVYERLIKCNFADRIETFKELQRLKDSILFSDNPFLFTIPIGNNKYSINSKLYGDIVVTKSFVRFIETDEIDRQKYFDFYIAPFIKSIVMELIK